MIGRDIVEYEQSGEDRAAYGANLIEMLATDMTRRFGRGFSRQSLWQMRQFGLAYRPQPLPHSSNLQTPSGDSSATLTNTTPADVDCYRAIHAVTVKAALREERVGNLGPRQEYR